MDEGQVAMVETSDEALAECVAQRDVAAFAVLYDRYARPAYVLAAHVLGAAEAEEVVQEAFLRLWHKASQFDPARGTFAAWFMTIVRHLVLAQLRERGRLSCWVRADSIDQLLAGVADPGPDLEELVWCRERSVAVLRVLQTLPAEQRRAIVLAYFGGMNQSSIAEALDWPLGTVKKRIRLGLQKLRAALAPDEIPSPETRASENW